jgi:hypothetical protein
MKELYRSPDMVDLSVVQSLLNSEGIQTVVFDRNASFMYGPSEALSPRLMVDDELYSRALRILIDAGYIKHDT